MTNSELAQSLSTLAFTAAQTTSAVVWERTLNEMMSFSCCGDPEQEKTLLYWMGVPLNRKPINARIPDGVWETINFCMEENV